MSENDQFVDRLAARLGGDVGLIITFFVGIYVLYIVFGLLLGYSPNGTVNALRRITFLAAVYALAVLALNLHWGYTGLFNIGIAGFMAVGVYTMAAVSSPVTGTPGGLGLPLWVGIVAGMLAAGVWGLITSLPALRLRADYLAIVTVGLSEIVRYTVQSTTFQPITGGGSGFTLSTTPASVIESVFGPIMQSIAPAGFPVTSSVLTQWMYAIFLLVMVAVFYWFLVRVGNSPFGRVLAGIREDEEATSSLGKNTPMFKVKSFVVGCALMGLVGILWQGSRGFINPSTFRPIVTFYIWIAIIIGGAGSNTGSVIGGALFAGLLFEGPRYIANVLSSFLHLPSSPGTIIQAFGGPMLFLSYLMNNVGPIRLILTGVVLVVLMHRRPDGLLGHRTEPAAAVNILGDRENEARTATTGEELAQQAGGEDDE